ncbi:uncharacterized protein LOC124364677 [Homalodisca vitripennis]|uniref:uncharacterized protein LOC124364677 n=1 Tax=Homalodisca vitripennis TaxID=197043 RepID=UPI001EECE6F4|nr:uncharacterized protein LOC124364677 [Homalodisca vitripennis]
MSTILGNCEECGCACRHCGDSANLHLHVEIENLKQRLLEREHHIVKMETNFLKEADKFPNGEMAALTDELLTWQDKYSRLYEAHKRVQKVNQNLEDKLLRIVDKCETEKNSLTGEVASLTRRLVDEKFNISRLQEENERYRNDVNLAIQLLQCKPSNFVSQKYDSLPHDMQQKVRSYVSSKRRIPDGNGNIQSKTEMKTIKVPIPTFPPTAMVYSVNKSPSGLEKEQPDEKHCKQGTLDIVSAAIMAKVLEEREKERAQTRHCESCTCPIIGVTQHVSTQTIAVETCDKCLNTGTGQSKEEQGLVGRSSSPMSVRGKAPDKPCDFTTLAAERLGRRGWERAEKDSCVREGVLVNLDTSDESEPDRPRGPRHCSVRLQAGSSNILLDNVVNSSYTPVLYKSRPDALVHSPRSRSGSSNSSTEERPLRTETQI